MIEYRSDTFTKPTQGMLDAMMSAEVGDDVFHDDPTVIALEEKLTNMFGMEAGLFCPSGTMSNQIAIRIHTRPQDEVICHKYSHVHLYEGGGIASNSGASVNLLDGERGRITASQIDNVIKPDDVHSPISRLVCIENTMNKGGGSYYNLNDLKEIKSICKKHELNLHLDGARLFNAIVETGDDPKLYGSVFDTISICLSKGLGAPIGSVLIGANTHIKRARRVRKVFGGGMRQAGYLAAAGIYALDNHIERLKDDHQRARIIAGTLQQCAFVDSVMPVDTNIIICNINTDVNITIDKFKEQGMHVVPFGSKQIRLVTHLGITDAMVDQTIDILKKI